MRNPNKIKIIIYFLIVFCSVFFVINNLFANDLIWILNPSNNHYYAVTAEMSWSDAETLANSYGGHLVTINNQDENDWLISAFGSLISYWIGLSDIGQEGVWVWSSGETPTFDNWCQGEPNDCCSDDIQGEENGVAMNECGGIGWNDLPDLHAHYAIIEVSRNIEATIDVDPDTVNLKSKGKYITCYIELPEGFTAEDIVIETVKLSVNENEIEAELFPTGLNDYNDNNITDLMVKFNRENFYSVVDIPVAEIMVSGDLITGESFQGTDTVLVIEKGNEHYSEDHGSIVY